MSKENWLGMAQESFASAELLFEQGRFRSCGSRAYFAIYQAAQGILHKAGLDAPDRGNWSHEKTIHCLDEGAPKNMLRRQGVSVLYLRQGMTRLRDVRRHADYNPVAAFSQSNARDAVRFAGMVVRIARKVS